MTQFLNSIGTLIKDRSDEQETVRAGLRETWRSSLTNGAPGDPTDTVLAELGEYFKLPPDQIKERCINWQKYSVEEWQACDRESAQGLLDFYQTQVSWIFTTMWHHCQQYHEQVPAQTTEVALRLSRAPHCLPPGQHLDFGAGPGTSSVFFHALGWQVSLAEISTTMLDFARWRLAKHAVPATFYDTTRETLPDQTFDLITAFDVIVHIPDAPATLADLRRKLKPGGYLVFNIDNRPRNVAVNAWHLYEDKYPILQKVRSLGFRRYRRINRHYVFQKIERGPLNTRLVRWIDHLRYNQFVTKFLSKPARRLYHKLRV